MLFQLNSIECKFCEKAEKLFLVFTLAEAYSYLSTFSRYFYSFTNQLALLIFLEY